MELEELFSVLFQSGGILVYKIYWCEIWTKKYHSKGLKWITNKSITKFGWDRKHRKQRKNIEGQDTDQNVVVEAFDKEASEDGAIEFVTPKAQELVAEERIDVLATGVPATYVLTTDAPLTQDFDAESFDQVLGDYIEQEEKNTKVARKAMGEENTNEQESYTIPRKKRNSGPYIQEESHRPKKCTISNEQASKLIWDM